MRQGTLALDGVDRAPSVIDPTPGAEARRRFNVAALLAGRNLAHLAEDLDRSPRTIERWIVQGVDFEQADLIAAVVLNRHALDVFGPEWGEAAGYPALAAAADIVEPEPSLFD